MAWSTNQLADLAGVSLRSIRYWHEIGLLPEPERLTNNYKQYTVGHLVLTLRIKRLTGLGFSLEKVAKMLATNSDAQKSMQELRDELADTITQLEHICADLDRMLALGVSPDLSPEALRAIEVFGKDKTGRSIAIVFAHLVPADDTVGLADTLIDDPGDLPTHENAFTQLPEDATPRQINSIVEEIVASVESVIAHHPELITPSHQQKIDRVKVDAFTATVLDGLNLAQREVMRQVFQRISTYAEQTRHLES